jgi:hypothetical protein
MNHLSGVTPGALTNCLAEKAATGHALRKFGWPAVDTVGTQGNNQPLSLLWWQNLNQGVMHVRGNSPLYRNGIGA